MVKVNYVYAGNSFHSISSISTSSYDIVLILQPWSPSQPLRACALQFYQSAEPGDRKLNSTRTELQDDVVLGSLGKNVNLQFSALNL